MVNVFEKSLSVEGYLVKLYFYVGMDKTMKKFVEREFFYFEKLDVVDYKMFIENKVIRSIFRVVRKSTSVIFWYKINMNYWGKGCVVVINAIVDEFE